MTTAEKTIHVDGGTAPVVPPGDAKVPHRWRNLAVLTLSLTVDSTEAGLVNTLFPAIARALGLDSGQLGILAAVGKFLSAPAGPAWVWVSQRTSRKFVLVLSSFLAAAFGAGAGFSQGFISLLVLNTLMTISIIGAAPIANAVIMDSFDDKTRAKATSYFYGVLSAASAFLGPALALFTRTEDGWRYGLITMGALCALAGILQFLFFKDPGVGASDKLSMGANASIKEEKPTARQVLGLFRIPTFTVMMLSRLLSGHLLIMVFGIQFLVIDRGFDNATAALVLIPFGIGYVVGTVGGGTIVGILDKFMPDRGRVAYIQFAQIFFAGAAFFGTQFGHGSIGIYSIFWALMGMAQGMNPAVNRPIVASVVAPELRGQAFAIFITVFETIGWAIFSLGAGQLANTWGLQQVFLWILVFLMIINAVVLGSLYVFYPRDVAKLKATMMQRAAVNAV